MLLVWIVLMVLVLWCGNGGVVLMILWCGIGVAGVMMWH